MNPDINSELGYGYNDPAMLNLRLSQWTLKKWLGLMLAIGFLFGIWFALNQKLLFGSNWLSETYDNEHWRTNEGNLHTFGAWDIEAHIWKTEYIIENFPNYHWNPYWYLGMPLLKYYQSGFYMLHWMVVELTGITTARAVILLIIFSHLIAALLTFLVCYKVSRRLGVSALCSSFILSNTFITLRSYGWEPITVIFLFLYPLGMLLFLKEPLRPFRFWLILVLGISYISHPLLWFSLCMMIGIYLLSIAIRKNVSESAAKGHYILQFIGVVLLSLLIGGVQFLPQITYQQATSGAHMGVKYLPYYQVPFNIITLKDFFFDAGNLKGPGPIIMISFFLLATFAFIHYIKERNKKTQKLHNHSLIMGLALTLFVMVLFYYMEFYNIFPMNYLRSIQYHRIIPEFVITAAVLVAALSNIPRTSKQKAVYYSMLVTFVAASGIIIYLVQGYWQTTDSISQKPEFIYDKFEGRISFPYSDQSLAVRNSFTKIPQAYGYYEQGITNSYNDEVFSVSSGFHNAELTELYLKAANIGRLYVNLEEGERDKIVRSRLDDKFKFVKTENPRYGYFEIPLANAQFAQAVDAKLASAVQSKQSGCRIIFMEEYCGSRGEEFVSTDKEEIRYLTSYVELLETPNAATASMNMANPNLYTISVKNANPNTAVVVKMTHDQDFVAKLDGKELKIEPFGPDFMLIWPNSKHSDFTISLEYSIGIPYIAGLFVSIATLLVLAMYFLVRRRSSSQFYLYFPKGDLQ